MTETYFTEDLPWTTFVSICSKEMNLREGSIPEFSWKFDCGAGSKVWTTLSKDSYPRMMVAAAKRIRARAKREADLKDPDLGSGWRIDLKLENKVQVVEKEHGSDEDEEASVREKAEGKGKGKGKKRRRKGAKGKGPTKQRRGGPPKKVPHPPIRTPLRLTWVIVLSRKRSRRNLARQTDQTWRAIPSPNPVTNQRR